MKKGFSLIELLISLIVISLIISTFIPILTKKLKYQNSTLAAGVINCKKFDEKCMLCDKKECTLCSTQLNLLDGQYVDPKESCTIKNCPNNCAKCDTAGCKQCKEDYSLVEGQCIKLCLKIGNICVQKFNAGDPGGLEIPVGVEIRNTATSGVSKGGDHTRAICWKGENTSGCNAANGGYSGCNRTICTWYAADKICKYHGLRLPNNSELASFLAYSKGKGADGLQLCDNYSGYSSAKCTTVVKCPGSYDGACDPRNIWSGQLSSTYRAYNYYLFQGILQGPETNHTAFAFSVRCVENL